MLRPAVVTADEPVSALDVSVQAQVLNLMRDLQDELGIAYLFISHDISVVRHMAQDVLVMYAGRPAEQGDADAVLNRPRHPYTRLLLASTPFVDPARRVAAVAVRGEPPSPVDLLPGCAFASRCPHATDFCKNERPTLRPIDERLVACHYAEQIAT
jgi:dipeptide transport system ATP-binding protein